MGSNIYFSQRVRSESDLIEDLVVECVAQYGQEVYYLPRNLISRDVILNEEIESKFGAAYIIDAYLENVEGFGGDGSFLSKFGLEIREQCSFVITRRQWQKLVGVWNNGILKTRPAEGDLIYLPLTKSLFEIKWVETKSPFFQLSKVPVYKLQCELFEYSNEDISTGIDALDSFQLENATEYVFDIGNSNGTDFTVGETITQNLTTSISISAKVLRVELTADPIKLVLGGLVSNSGKFEKFRVSTGSSDTVNGLSSGAEWSITRCYNIGDTDVIETFKEDGQAQNQELETAANDIIDWDERNPFGEARLS